MQKYAYLVELEKCCQTHIFLQNFVLIQPRTSPLKICKIFEKCIFEKCIFEKCIFRKCIFRKCPRIPQAARRSRPGKVRATPFFASSNEQDGQHRTGTALLLTWRRGPENYANPSIPKDELSSFSLIKL